MKTFFLFFISSLCSVLAYIAIIKGWSQRNTQEKEIPYMDTTNAVYVPYRDTMYIDRSRPINKPWYSYEIESGEDSIYLYSGRELIKALSRKDATVFAIDSLIIADNL